MLQSQRIEHTQALAQELFAGDYDGIVYASAQHPHHACLCLFQPGCKKIRFVEAWPLVKPDTELLHGAVVDAARRSGIDIV